MLLCGRRHHYLQISCPIGVAFEDSGLSRSASCCGATSRGAVVVGVQQLRDLGECGLVFNVAAETLSFAFVEESGHRAVHAGTPSSMTKRSFAPAY
jgi:hypothetical protein